MSHALNDCLHPCLHTFRSSGAPTHILATLRPSGQPGRTILYLTAKDVLPTSSADYLDRKEALTPRFQKALGSLQALYFHSKNATPTTHRLAKDAPPPPNLPEPFASAPAFTCAFTIDAEDPHADLRAAARYLHSDLWLLFEQQPGGTCAPVPNRPFIPDALYVITHPTPHGQVTFVVHRDDLPDTGTLSASGLVRNIDFPELPVLETTRLADSTPYQIRAQVPRNTDLHRLLWEDWADCPDTDRQLATDLEAAAWQALASFAMTDLPIRRPYNLHVAHDDWRRLQNLNPRVNLPKPFACPWQPAACYGGESRCEPPVPIQKDSTYVVRLEQSADQHLLSLAARHAWKDTLLVYDHPKMRGYPFFDRLPVITGLRPSTPSATDDTAADDIAITSVYNPSISLDIVYPDAHHPLGELTTCRTLPTPIAFAGIPGSSPQIALYLQTRHTLSSKDIVDALVQSYFTACPDEDGESAETQYQHYRLLLMDAVGQHLDGFEATQKALLQYLFDTTVRHYVSDRPMIISWKDQTVDVYFQESIPGTPEKGTGIP